MPSGRTPRVAPWLPFLLLLPLVRVAAADNPAADCLDAPAIEARLARAISRRDRLDLHVAVTAIAADPKTIASLTVTRSNKTVLERSYPLSKEDCRSAGDLFAAVLDRFLDDFPIESWAAPTPKTIVVPRIETRRALRRLELSPRVALNSVWLPTNGDAELGAKLALGIGAHRIGMTLLARAALPESVGGGHFQVTMALAGLGWAYEVKGWRPGFEVRTGPLFLSGYGFSANQTHVLPWVEGVVSVERAWKNMWFGVQVAASPLHQRAVASGATENLSILRVGLTWSITAWKKKW